MRVVGLLFLVSCSSPQSTVDPNVAPEWFPKKPSYTIGDKVLTNKMVSSATEEGAYNSALSLAKEQMEELIFVQGIGMTKSLFLEEVGPTSANPTRAYGAQKTGVIPPIHDEFVEVTQKTIVPLNEGQLYTCYLEISYPMSIAKKQAIELLKSDEEYFIAFKSSKTYSKFEKHFPFVDW